jgi:hypothetical protein
VCVTTLYIQDDIMILFTMGFKCVLKILKTYVKFTALQEENCFCSRKMFTSIKLTGVETLLPVCILFQLNENTNMCTVNSDNSDCISHRNTHTQIIFVNLLMEFFSNFPSPLSAVARSKFPISRCCLITKLHGVLLQTAVMNLHIVMTQPSSYVGRMS